jgi:dTDP-4-dehydrorhamnose reductase
MAPMRLLVTGAGGMLGQDVTAAARRAGHDVVALTRAELDVSDAAAVRHAVASATPAAVINCAAWTDVDGAEAGEDAATAINGAGAGNVASAAAAAGALIVHVSSDYVFAGDATEPYTEDAPVAPASAYGRSKLAGERAVAESAQRSAIVRSSWLFGAGGKNFVDTMLRLAGERDEVTVVDDQVGCPTFTGHLAEALVEVAERGLTGVLHVAGGGQCSWHDLAVAAYAERGLSCTVNRGRTADLGRPAPRPAYSVLRSGRDDAPRLPDWEEGLRAHLRSEVTA